MKVIIIDEFKLFYTETNHESSRSVLFLNGNSHGRKSFHKQHMDQRFKNYRLISVDLPGHGDSSQMDEYSLINLADIINKFIKKINLSNFIIVGHSLGGHVAIHLLKETLPIGLVIFGTPPLLKPFSMIGFLNNKNAIPLSQESANLTDLKILAKELRYTQSDEELFIEDYYKTDKKFRPQLFQSVFNGKYYDESELLNQYSGNVMVLISSEDKIVNNDYISQIFINPKYRITTLKGGHSPHLELADEFNKTLFDFTNEIPIIANLQKRSEANLGSPL